MQPIDLLAALPATPKPEMRLLARPVRFGATALYDLTWAFLCVLAACSLCLMMSFCHFSLFNKLYRTRYYLLSYTFRPADTPCVVRGAATR